MMYASANRDERKWDQAERFDVRRKVGEHVGFGHGIQHVQECISLGWRCRCYCWR